MVNPTGYTALDMIGFTDKGTYSSSDNYVKNDLVHYSGNIWRCLIDDTSGIAPAEGVNWTLFIGEPTNLVERIIAPVETDPATSAWAVGRQIIFNDNLYEVIAAITAGDALVTYEDDPTNANIKLADPVETQVLAQKTQIQTLSNQVNNLEKYYTVYHGKAYGNGANGVKNWSEIAKEAADALISAIISYGSGAWIGKKLVVDSLFINGIGTYDFAYNPITISKNMTTINAYGQYNVIDVSNNKLRARTIEFGASNAAYIYKIEIDSNSTTASYEGSIVPTSGNVTIDYRIMNDN